MSVRRDRHDAEESPGTRGDEVRQALVRETYGGFKLRAAVFGCLATGALVVLLVGVAGAVAVAVGAVFDVTATQARQWPAAAAGTAVVLLVVPVVSFFAGGYVAGRMARFDGGRRGLGVWGLGVRVTVAVAAAGTVWGTQTDLVTRAAQATPPADGVWPEAAVLGAALVVVVWLVGTATAAVLGGGQVSASTAGSTTPSAKPPGSLPLGPRVGHHHGW